MIVEFGFDGPGVCEDIEDDVAAGTGLRTCMAKLTITEGNSKDAKGLERFYTFEDLNSELPLIGPIGERPDLWYRKFLFTETKVSGMLNTRKANHTLCYCS